MKIQDQCRLSANWSFCRTHGSNTTTQMERNPNASWQYSFIHKLLQPPLKLCSIQKLRSNSSLLLMRHFYKRIFFLGKNFELGKTNGGWILKTKQNNSCLDWWLTCLEFSGQAFHFLITAISPPILNSLSLGLTEDREITDLCCWSSLHVFQQENYFISAVRVPPTFLSL